MTSSKEDDWTTLMEPVDKNIQGIHKEENEKEVTETISVKQQRKGDCGRDQKCI